MPGNEVQELKQHIRWLQGQVKEGDGIGETVDEINLRLDTKPYGEPPDKLA
jgi:hypothetical protein